MFNPKMLTQKIIIGVVILLMLFLMGCGSNQNKNASTANQQNNTSTNLTQENKNNSNTSLSPKPTTTTHTLLCTPKELQDEFNYQAKNQAKINVRMGYYNMSSGSTRNTYTYNLATGLNLILGVNKNNGEVEIISLVRESNSNQSPFNFVMSMGVLINMFTSEVPAGQIMQDLGFKGNDYVFNGIGGTKIVDDVKFTCTGNKDGVVFMISNPNN